MTSPLPRDLFAVTERYAYLNHAATGVLPRPTADALHAFIDAHAQSGVLGTSEYEKHMEEYRARVARFIGALPGEIAVLRSTSEGANAVASGYRWSSGDCVILPDDEFGSNLQPWLRLRRSGVELQFVRTAQKRLTADVLRARMTPRTKVVTVSWVSFEDGYRHDLAALSEVAHQAGAMFCVDAIQGLGAFPMDVKACGIDALYCGGAKWLLALQGVSFLYVDSNWLERLDLAAPGWRSVADMWDFRNYDQPFAADATRFEGGTPNFAGALSLSESIHVLETAGAGNIARHVLELTDYLVDGLGRLGATVASIRGASESSGIVTFTLPGIDPVELGKRLGREGIIVTYRANGIRVAPHGYNVRSEIDRLLDAVEMYRSNALVRS